MLEGACHCGSVKWTYSLPLESVTACNCTLCARYGSLWAYAHLNHGITTTGPTSSYMRGSKINKYHFCTNCGCVVYYLAIKPDEQGRLRMAVNLRTTTEPAKIADLPIDHFDGLDKFEDLPRDERTVKSLWF